MDYDRDIMKMKESVMANKRQLEMIQKRIEENKGSRGQSANGSKLQDYSKLDPEL